MTPALPAIAISVQAGRRHLAELTGHGGDHRGWRVSWIVEESAEETRCSKLHREPDPVMRTTHPADQFAVGSVEMEVAGELLFRWDRRRSGRTARAVRRTESGSAWRAELRISAWGRAWTKYQALTSLQKSYAEWYVYAISFARRQRPGHEAWLRSRLDRRSAA